jgi:hypothetical protein
MLQKVPRTTSKFNKAVGYRKLCVFLYSSNEELEFELNKIIAV